MKKQILAILLLVSLILPAVVNYFWTQQRITVVKRETKQMIAKANFDQLIVFQFSKEETLHLNWKHSHEFEYQNKMYDVVKQTTKGDSIQYNCWLDKEETALNLKLKTLLVDIYQKDIPLQKQKRSFYQFYKSLYFVENKDVNLIKNQFFIDKETSFTSNLYQFLTEKSLFHPPNVFSC